MTLALLITAAGGAWAQTETLLTTITPTGTGTYSETTTGVVTVTPSGQAGYDSTYGWLWGNNSGSVTVEAKEAYTITQCVFKQNDKTPVTITTSPFAITFANGICVEDAKKFMNGVTSIEVYGYAPAAASSGPEVTINEAKTEASFKMPQYDVTATYTLKRDLSVETQVTVGDDHDAQPRYRVQKQGNTFQPVGMDQAQVMALFHVHDQIEDEDLAPVQDYTVQIYAVDIEGQPTGDAITFQNFTYAPGQYIVKAVAKDGSNYVGQTTESNIFTLYQGYEIVVAANEYATYYKDEALYIEDEDAQLYTITAVGKETATATEVTTAAANMPILVKNNSTETKTILLIPTTEQTPDDVTPYEGFRGTLEATTIAASTENQNNYAFNGKQFVWVKDALDIAANKAWLEVSTGDYAAGARAINIVFGDATGISTTNYTNFTNGDWYDLNGRKLQNVPTKKGVYILNGKKVVVK